MLADKCAELETRTSQKRGKKPMSDERYIEHCMSRIKEIKVELAGKKLDAKSRYKLINQKVA